MTTATIAQRDTAPKQSPWGKVNTSYRIAPGLWSVSTPSHGGIRINAERNAMIPGALRNPDGWYEEDCEWAIVCCVFKDEWRTWGDQQTWTTGTKQIHQAWDTVLNWYPDHAEALTGIKPTLALSHKLRERAFRERTRSSYVVVCAWSHDHSMLPTEPIGPGMVAVLACIGGRQDSGAYGPDERYFAVPAAEYAQRESGCGFIVDVATHKELQPKA